MTSSEALKRSEKSQNLKVLHLEDSPWYYVESEEGKICYKVCYESETEYLCNCADFAKGYRNDRSFKCKHVMAVMNSVTDGDSEKKEKRIVMKERRKEERFKELNEITISVISEEKNISKKIPI